MIDSFLAYLEEQVTNHSIYVWGAQGQGSPTVDAAWIREKETSKRNGDRAVAFWKRQVRLGFGDVLRAFDCSGLGVYHLLNAGWIERDMTADDFLNCCDPVARELLQPGDFVFRVGSRGRAYHIGYVVDAQKNVIQAKGRDDGVIRTPLGNWDRFGRPRFFMEQGEKEDRILRLKSPRMRGEQVTTLQSALFGRGFSPGEIDGIFGRKTESAVKTFQQTEGIMADGAAGPVTHKRLNLPFRPESAL